MCIKPLCEHGPYRKHKKMCNLFCMRCANKICANKPIIILQSIISYEIHISLFFVLKYNMENTYCRLNVCLIIASLNESLKVCFLWKGCEEDLNFINTISIYFFPPLFIFTTNSSMVYICFLLLILHILGLLH